MKQFFIVLFLFTICFSGFAEEKFHPATITFYDGDQYSGFAKFNRKQAVVFKISEEDVAEELDAYVIKRIIFHIEPYNVFEYVYYKNRYKLLQKIAEGTMTVYAQFDEPINEQITLDKFERATLNDTEIRAVYAPSTGMTTYQQNYTHPFDKRVRFFITRTTEKTIEDIKLNFRKEAREWFKDCPEVVAYTDRKEWKYEDLKIIVEFYNEFCGKE